MVLRPTENCLPVVLRAFDLVGRILIPGASAGSGVALQMRLQYVLASLKPSIMSAAAPNPSAPAHSQLTAPPVACDSLTVMFDGACPLCRREIGLYQSLTPLETVAWLDVSEVAANLNPTDQARFMARFHVRQKDGSLLSGAEAFVALWLTMPGWRWLGRLARLPGITPLLELAYRGFLHLRPTLQRWMRSA